MNAFERKNVVSNSIYPRVDTVVNMINEVMDTGGEPEREELIAEMARIQGRAGMRLWDRVLKRKLHTGG